MRTRHSGSTPARRRRTFAQALVAVLVVRVRVHRRRRLGRGAAVQAVAALVSLLTSVAASGVGDPSRRRCCRPSSSPTPTTTIREDAR